MIVTVLMPRSSLYCRRQPSMHDLSTGGLRITRTLASRYSLNSTDNADENHQTLYVMVLCPAKGHDPCRCRHAQDYTCRQLVHMSLRRERLRAARPCV